MPLRWPSASTSLAASQTSIPRDCSRASQYVEGENLVDMIKENLVAERIAVDHYRELIRYFGDDDPGTRSMLQGILRTEEEHADDMHDLLVAHEGKPMLEG
jgi:bacterioferritin